MLPKKARLTKKIIETELGNARRLKTAHFLVLYTLSGMEKHPRISFSVSKKVAKRAVDRNRIRRRGYSAVAPLLIGCKQSARILVQCSSTWEMSSISDIRHELYTAFSSIQIL
jgi:ribonuclease P protein component